MRSKKRPGNVVGKEARVLLTINAGGKTTPSVSVNRYLELAIVIVGIYVCFLTWGLTQERVTTTPYNGKKFKYFIVLNVVQSAIASLVAFVYVKLRGQSLGNPSTPLLWKYTQLSVIHVIASPFGYASLKYIDYPTMILGKSCKLVPVMLMNLLLYRKRFPIHKYFIVGLITTGVSAFMLLHPAEGKHKGKAAVIRTVWESLWGIFLLTINLALDGITNSTQDQIFHQHRATGSQMMFYMNLVSSGVMAVFLLFSNWYTAELTDALAFCTAHPAVVRDIVLFGVCGAVGQCFIFHTIERFGSLTTVTITVTRKMFSIILSVLWYNHPLGLGQWFAVGVVFVGIGLEAFWKGKVNKDVEKKRDERAEEVVLDEKRETVKEVKKEVKDTPTGARRRVKRAD
ncbi:UDP-galactose transporter [Blyttiomyces sp. JEL0837]|nr:UDP-galactose transporter [Blyttiomyces sp. JEL0837]